MANPTDIDVKDMSSSRPVDEPHLRNLPRPGKDKGNVKAILGKKSGIEPVDLETPKSAKTAETSPAMETHPAHVDGVVPATGVAHLSGLTLRFPLHTKIMPGEVVVVGRKPFEVRKDKLLTPMFAVKGVGLLVLAVMAVIGVTSMFTSPSGGSVSGVVLDRTTGQIIPNATVSIEGGSSSTTNLAGLYSFDGLRSGLFKMTATAPGYEPQSGSVVRPADGGAQLAFALMPVAYAGSSAQSMAPSTQAESSVSEAEADANNEALAYGNINLETDFENYLVFVDGVLYGKDAKKIKRMNAGEHRVILQLDGFEDFSTNIDVKARSTHTVQVAKADLTPKVDPVKRSKAFFAEAKDLLDRGLYPAAIDKYNLGLKDDPQNASALQYRGWAYSKAGNVEAARADLLKAANLHAEVNRFLDAVACAGHLIEISPEDASAFLRRAKYYTQMREHDKAIKDCEIAVKLDKKSLTSQLALAEACFVAGDYKRAAKEFDKGRKLSDNPADVYVNVLISLARGGEDDQVRKKFKDFSEIASPELQKKLKDNPDWLRVLQIVDPTKRSEG